MEPRFGQDFSGVRVHTDDKAAESARAVNARAYTVGRDVVFGAGEYSPGSGEGRRLMAHELVHVGQQKQSLHYRIQKGNQSETERVSKLNENYENAITTKDWQKAAELLNAFNRQDILSKLSKLRRGQIGAIHQGAIDNPSVGSNSQVAELTIAAHLDLNYENEIKAGRWGQAAVFLNGFNDTDIRGRLQKLKPEQLKFIFENCPHWATRVTRAIVALDPKTALDEKNGIDYTELFKDKKLDVGIAIGDEFKAEYDAIIAMLETAGKNMKNFSSTESSGGKIIRFTKEFPIARGNAAAQIAVDVKFDIIYAGSSEPKKTYTEFLSQKEIVIYSGHARYGTGPDFDSKKSVKENFIIGVNSALHKTGKLLKGYNAHMNKILEGYANDLESMSNSGKIDPDKYQVWFFNACSSINYLDEIRGGLVRDKSGKTKSKAKLRIMGTKESIYSDAIKIVESILDMKTMDEIINIMDANEKVKVKDYGEKAKRSYYFSD